MAASRNSIPGNMQVSEDVSRVSMSISGVVQGVGFRPFVYQLAGRHGLKGWVRNTSGDVKIDAEGKQKAIDKFLADLEVLAPPLTQIESILITPESTFGYEYFEIRDSVSEEGRYQRQGQQNHKIQRRISAFCTILPERKGAGLFQR